MSSFPLAPSLLLLLVSWLYKGKRILKYQTINEATTELNKEKQSLLKQ